MRTRVLIICAIVVSFCLWLLLHRAADKAKSNSREVQTMSTNQPSWPEPIKAADDRQPSNTSQTLSIPPSATPLAQALAKTNPVAAIRLALWQAPIEFYGKVVDENSNPVAKVNIHFSWYDIPAKDGERTADTQSDSEGMFSLHGKHGPSLTVGFSKEGYYSSQRGEMTFNPEKLSWGDFLI